MREQFKSAPNDYSIENLNNCCIQLSLGLENDISLICSVFPKFWVKL